MYGIKAGHRVDVDTLIVSLASMPCRSVSLHFRPKAVDYCRWLTKQGVVSGISFRVTFWSCFLNHTNSILIHLRLTAWLPSSSSQARALLYSIAVALSKVLPCHTSISQPRHLRNHSFKALPDVPFPTMQDGQHRL